MTDKNMNFDRTNKVS